MGIPAFIKTSFRTTSNSKPATSKRILPSVKVTQLIQIKVRQRPADKAFQSARGRQASRKHLRQIIQRAFSQNSSADPYESIEYGTYNIKTSFRPFWQERNANPYGWPRCCRKNNHSL